MPATTLPNERDIDWSRPVHMTFEQFLDFEEQSEEKHEYVDGLVIPLTRLIADSGGSMEHSTVKVNLVAEGRAKTTGTPCRVFDSDLAVKRRNLRKYRYPDMTIVCGEPQLDPNVSRRRAINNPSILFEVLSSTTADTDRTEKLVEYAAFNSFLAYVQIETLRPFAHILRPGDDGGWRLETADGLDDVLRLRDIDVELSMAELYRDVDFAAARAARAD